MSFSRAGLSKNQKKENMMKKGLIEAKEEEDEEFEDKIEINSITYKTNKKNKKLSVLGYNLDPSYRENSSFSLQNEVNLNLAKLQVVAK